MKKFNQKYLALGLLLIVLTLTACDKSYEQGNFSQQKIRVEEEKIHRQISFNDIDESFLSDLSENYYRYGDGVMDVTVIYNPKSKKDNAMNATGKAAEIASVLTKKHHVPVKTSILPLKDAQNTGGVLFSYQSYNALAPEDCELYPGLVDRDHKVSLDYKFGCNTNTIMAKQIARPKDLMGRGGKDASVTGRVAFNKTSSVRSGAFNEHLQGESASE